MAVGVKGRNRPRPFGEEVYHRPEIQAPENTKGKLPSNPTLQNVSLYQASVFVKPYLGQKVALLRFPDFPSDSAIQRGADRVRCCLSLHKRQSVYFCISFLDGRQSLTDQPSERFTLAHLYEPGQFHQGRFIGWAEAKCKGCG